MKKINSFLREKYDDFLAHVWDKKYQQRHSCCVNVLLSSSSVEGHDRAFQESFGCVCAVSLSGRACSSCFPFSPEKSQIGCPLVVFFFASL